MPGVAVRRDRIPAAVRGRERPRCQKRLLLGADLADWRHFLSMYRKQDVARPAYSQAMPNNLARFAIGADDVPRARHFYEQVFGWQFEPWGPPNFYLIETGEEHIRPVGGLLQQRRELVPGNKMVGFECTIGVDDIDRTIHAIEANGGKIAMAKFHIPTVGKGVYFFDTEGNVVGAMQYE
jgi:predicted enzyme related to lactoylglutathione lyase